MSNLRYSIIIPVYNTQLYLEQCLNSILKHNKSYEVIVINDGSTDNSSIILEKYVLDSRVKYISQVNQGLSNTRNNGLKVARGEYIYFLDSDDYISENFFEVLDSLILNNRPDIILFSAHPFFELKSNTFLSSNYSRYPLGAMKSVEYFQKALKKGKYFVQACMYVFKRNILEDIRFIPEILHEDNVFTTQILLNNKNLNVISIADELYYRRFRDNSIMTSAITIRNFNGYYTGLKELYEFNEKKINSYSLSLFVEKLYLSALFHLLVVNNFDKNDSVKYFLSQSSKYTISNKAKIIINFTYILKLYPIYKKIKRFYFSKR